MINLNFAFPCVLARGIQTRMHVARKHTQTPMILENYI